jgi:hypothetical protein
MELDMDKIVRENRDSSKQTQDMQIIHYGLCFSGNI